MSKKGIASLLKAFEDDGLQATVLSDESSPCVVSDFVSTGCYVLDKIMGGGLPKGRIVEMYGDTSTGKSLIAAQACASVQERGGIAVYIDTETAVSLPIMEAVGVDTESLVYLAPDTVEQVFKAMEDAVSTELEEEMLIVWDSVAATSAAAEMSKETGETGYLTHARIISQGLRKLTRSVSKTGTALLFLNQAKEAIGVMFGDRVATFGGKSIGFHSSIRVQLSSSSKLTQGSGKSKRTIGVVSKARVTKNKVAPPFREASLPIYFGFGIDEAEASLMLLKDYKVITSSGAWYSAPFIDKKFQSKDWVEIFDEYYGDIRKLVDEAVEGQDLV